MRDGRGGGGWWRDLLTNSGLSVPVIYLWLQFQSPQHSYKVKIINPHRKSNMIVRYLHNFNSRLESAVALRMKIVEEFKDVVPDSLNLSVGYFEGQNHSKIWLVTKEDFSTMYGRYPKGEITLWCDGRTEQEDDVSVRKKCKRDEVSSKRQEKRMRLMISTKN